MLYMTTLMYLCKCTYDTKSSSSCLQGWRALSRRGVAIAAGLPNCSETTMQEAPLFQSIAQKASAGRQSSQGQGRGRRPQQLPCASW